MDLSCTSFSFPLLSFADAAKVIALIGVPNLDVGAHEGGCHVQPAQVEADPSAATESIRRAVGEAGLGVSDFFATFGDGFRDRPVNTLNPSEREANLRRFRAILEVARGVGAKGVTLLPGVVWDEVGPDRSFARSVEELRRLVPLAHAIGLRLSVECHLESVAETPARALELVQSVPGLALTLDYSHFVANGYRPADVHPLVPHAGHFHARQARAGFLQSNRQDGTLDFPDILRRLQAADYAGDVCLEYTWQEWRGANNVDVLMETILLRDEIRSALI
ncbi:MAG TPA: sugar phosphate isomerase/epimerase family protein [Chloroflexota bacterium]|nr:sugar phosphate isomerase/epimerase family protein [Chloroflexota bacterium]